ncbi:MULTISPECIES: peptidoglycan-binding domain-containing protein [unclassified Corallococcus]|uniref:peptidoglycan-binding domain-containing protein n=1 Tax=unclassified Corallococcus TaxID=2685029 RepID=UPI001A8F204C|nr:MULTISPECIES: peptidoglycan-binding domain-containing protein [unclassified Corallococcus]MBN9685617.1 peptidoglycan-binding protein [Corallococcus sp. NCSPR001]WAS82937.1 peptidoglycan-binding domain-containing protein [Corallococcus sp. NCRR]
MRTTAHPHRPLHVGSTGNRVQKVEERLKSAGYLKGPADDRFDAKTAKAVVAFKRDNGWDGNPKGVVGERMDSSLKRVSATATPGTEGATTAEASAAGGSDRKGKTPSQLRGATYNVERDRNPQDVKKWLGDFAKKNKLDFVQLQEINGYHKALENIPGYHLVTFPGAKDHGETGILVKDSLLQGQKTSIQGEGGGWTTVRGGHAPPRAATAVKLAGWLQVVSAHQPPSVDWKGGEPVGPKNRVSTYKSLSEKLLGFAQRKIAKNPDEGLLIGGDWNEPASTKGKWSPGWIAQQAGMKLHGGVESHGHGKIDYAMSYGAKVTNVRAGPTGGSDHNIVMYTVSRPKGKG